MKQLSFKEKSLWALLISLVAVFGNYYIQLNVPDSAVIKRPEMFEFAFYAAFLAFVVLLGNFLISFTSNKEITDERQKQIEAKAQLISGYVLTIGVFHSIIVALVVPGNFWVVHNLFLSVLIAELVNIGLQLLYLRRGF